MINLGLPSETFRAFRTGHAEVLPKTKTCMSVGQDFCPNSADLVFVNNGKWWRFYLLPLILHGLKIWEGNELVESQVLDRSESDFLLHRYMTSIKAIAYSLLLIESEWFDRSGNTLLESNDVHFDWRNTWKSSVVEPAILLAKKWNTSWSRSALADG